MKTKFIALALLVILPPSCASKPFQGDVNGQLLNSSLYDPPQVTLIPGKVYEFQEGTLTGTGQKFHSDFWYMRALTIGGKP